MKEKKASSKRLGTEHVGKLLIRLSLPLSLSMLFQGLYNLIDSIYIAALGQEALTAMSLAAIPQFLVSMLATGLSVGMNAVISSSLGKKDQETAQAAYRGGMLLELGCALITMAFGMLGCRFFYSRFLTQEDIIILGTRYLGICMTFSLFSYLQVLQERLLQSVGLSRLAMISQGSGAVINMILDPLLIFGIRGYFALGMRGAAIATVFSQMAAACIGLVMNLRYNTEIHAVDSPLRIQKDVLHEIIRIGLPAVLMAFVNAIMDYIINQILAGFSAVAIASYGVYSKLQRFIQIPTAGLSSSIITVAAYNYGAKKADRVWQSLRWGVICYGVGYGVAAALFMFFPRVLLIPFRPTQEMMQICLPAFHIIGFTLLISVLNAPFSSFFQSVGRSGYSLFLIFFRQLLVRVPVAMLLARSGRLGLVWWCWPVSELASALLTLYLTKRIADTDSLLYRK